MTSLATAVLWCVLQVTCVGLAAAAGYLILRRRAPATATRMLLFGLTLPLLLTAAAISPWPSWLPRATQRPVAGETASDVGESNVRATPTPSYAPAPLNIEQPPIDFAQLSPVVEPMPVAPPIAAPPPPPVPTPVGIEALAPHWPTLGLLAFVTLLLIGGLRFFIGWFAVLRELGRSRPIDDNNAQQLLRELRSALDCRAVVTLRESQTLTTAATFGWRRPVILLPHHWRNWTGDEQRAVLAHELAHISRGHFVGWCAAQLGLSLHCYHPLLHWLAGRLRLEQEYEADSLAARATGGSAAYLRTLAHLALQDTSPTVVWPARAFLPSRGTVVRRIERLSEAPVPSPARLIRGAAVAILIGSGIVAAGLRPPAASVADKGAAAANSAAESPAGTVAAGTVSAEPNAAEHIVITGRVTQPDGHPAAGALVVLPIDGAYSFKDPAHVAQQTTDADGRYSLAVPTAWLTPPLWRHMFILWVHQPGYGVTTASLYDQLGAESSSAPVDVRLLPESNPRFQIVVPNSQPVAGAVVEVEYYDHGTSSMYLPQELIPRLAVTSGSDGMVTIPGIAHDRLWMVHVRTEEHGTQSFRVAHFGDGAELELQPAVHVRGRVNSPNPEWAKHLELRFLSRFDDVDVPGAVGHATVVTDDKGEFVIPRIAEGSLHVRTRLDPELPVRLYQSTTLRAPSDPQLELYLVPATRVRGRVVRHDNQAPVPDVQMCVDYGVKRHHAGDFTDANGVYEARVLPGPVYLQPVGDFYPDLVDVRGDKAHLAYEVPIIDEVFELPTIELYSTYPQTGRLIDETGQPMAGCHVWGRGDNAGFPSGESNANGEFELRLPHDYEVSAYGYRTANFEHGEGVIVSTEPLVLRAKPEKGRHRRAAATTPAVPAAPAVRVAAPDQPPAISLDASRRAPAGQPADHVVVSGRVTNFAGVPAVNALVVLPINFGWYGDRRDVVQVATSVDGRFSLQVPTAWLTPPLWKHLTTLWVHQPGYGLATANVYHQLNADTPREDIEVILPGESQPLFQVVDEVQRPVTDATIDRLHYRSSAAIDYVPQELFARIAAEPNSDGFVPLHAIERGKLHGLVIRSKGHGLQEFDVQQHPDGRTLILRDAAPLRGRVTSENPDYVKNIRLLFEVHPLKQYDRESGVGRAEAVTNDAGEFSVPLIARGWLHVDENLDEALPVRLQLPLQQLVPSSEPIEFPLVAGRRVRGRVVRQDDQRPVPGVSLVVQYSNFRQRDHVLTDAEGRFEARVIPGRASQQVIAIPDRDLTYPDMEWQDIGQVPEGDDIFEFPTIELLSTYKRTGLLVDAFGRPLANYSLWGVTGTRAQSWARTDSRGAFEIRFPKGVEIAAYGYQSPGDDQGTAEIITADPLRLRALPPAPEPVVIQQSVGGYRPHNDVVTISGRVTEPAGNPAAGARVVLPIHHGWFGARRDVAQAVTDAAGRYTLEVLAAQLSDEAGATWLHTLWVYQPGFALATADVAGQLDESNERKPVDLVLPPESPLTLRLIDEYGHPLTSGQVEPEHYLSVISTDYVPQEILERIAATPDSAGYVTLRAIEAARLKQIEVRTGSHGRQVFNVDGLPQEARLQLRAAVGVRGRIVGEDPLWARKRHLLFYTRNDRASADDRPSEGWAEVTTDDEGRFEIPALAIGKLRIQQRFDNSLPVRLDLPADRELPLDGPLELQFVPGVVARGRVVRQSDHSPVEHAQVGIVTRDDGQAHWTQSDANGEYELRVLPGTVRQHSVMANDLVQVGVQQPFDIPADAETFALPTIELQRTYSMAGRLVDAAHQPLAHHAVWAGGGGRRYGHTRTNSEGEFVMQLPDGVEIERYGFTTPADVMGAGVVVTTDPLVLRAEPYERKPAQ